MTKQCVECNTQLTGKQKMYCCKKCKYKHLNHNKMCYERQLIKGKERKLMLIKMKGGKCSNCGYNKNIAALTFHHIEPSEKELKLTIRECSNYSIKKLKKEVEKCSLLCHNCHMEVHYPHLEGLLDT